MIYSPFNQNNFYNFETFNSQVLLATGNNTQFNDIQGRSTNKFISKSLAAICDDKNEPQIKEHFSYAKQSNILMGLPITGAIDGPIYTPKYNSQNDPSIYISIGNVSDNVISQHSIYNYMPPNDNKRCGSSLSVNNMEVENSLKVNPYRDILADPYRRNRRQNRKDILELHEAYAELKEFEKQKVKCIKCENEVSKNRSFIYSGNFVCANCATNIQSNYLQDWIPRETRSFTGTTRKCDNCKRRRPTSQFVYKTFSGDLDYNSLCRFCLLKKETCSHQASFKKRYYNLYKYKKVNYYDSSINAIIENGECDDDDDDEDNMFDNEKFISNRNKIFTKSVKPLSPQMIQPHPNQEEKIVIPKKRGRKRKNIEILLQQNKELDESSKKQCTTQQPPPPPPPSQSTEINNNKNSNNPIINKNNNPIINKNNNPIINKINNPIINNTNRTSHIITNRLNTIVTKNININNNGISRIIVNNNNINNAYTSININTNYGNNSTYKFPNRISNSYYNTFISPDIKIPKPYPPIAPHADIHTQNKIKPLYDNINEKLKELLESKKYHNNPQIVKFENEERIVVSEIGSIPLNVGPAFNLYKLNLKMLVRCSKCNKNVLKDKCIIDSEKCYVCNLCMKEDEEKSDWSLIENSRSVNDILCISCKMRKTVDQFLKTDDDDVLCIKSICRHCFLTKGKDIKTIR